MVTRAELAISPEIFDTCVHELRPPPSPTIRSVLRHIALISSPRDQKAASSIHLIIYIAASELPSFLLFVEEIALGGVGKQLPARMTGKEILHKIKAKAGFASSSDTGKGKCKVSGRSIRHGYHLVKGKSSHPMEDYLVAEFKKVDHNELGLFAVFDGHLGHSVADYLSAHLFDNILKEPEFFSDIETAIRRAYDRTDNKILEKTAELGRGGSTAVTAILINGSRLVVANVGDSRAVLSKNGVAIQLSVDHEPSVDREMVEEKGGFVSNIPGDVPRVDGQLAVTRAFGDGSLKKHLSSEPHVVDETVDDDTELLILASDGLWKVMSNQEVVDFIKDAKDPQTAAKNLTEEAVVRKSKDDISCIVVKFN